MKAPPFTKRNHDATLSRPTSKARIPQGVSVVKIFLQMLLWFIPGALVEVMPPTLVLPPEDSTSEDMDEGGTPTSRSGPTTKRARPPSKMERSESLTDDFDVTLGAPGTSAEDTPPENSLADLASDVSSCRWFHFFEVPKVKFVTYIVLHLSYIGLFLIVAFRRYSLQKRLISISLASH